MAVHRHHQRGVAAGGVAPHGHALRVDAEVPGVVEQPPRRGDGVGDLPGERGDRGRPVLDDRDHVAPLGDLGEGGEPGPQQLFPPGRSLHEHQQREGLRLDLAQLAGRPVESGLDHHHTQCPAVLDRVRDIQVDQDPAARGRSASDLAEALGRGRGLGEVGVAPVVDGHAALSISERTPERSTVSVRCEQEDRARRRGSDRSRAGAGRLYAGGSSTAPTAGSGDQYAGRDPGRPRGAHRHPAGRRVGPGRRRLRHRRLRPGHRLDLPAHGGRSAAGRAADPGPRRAHRHPVDRRAGAGGGWVRRREHPAAGHGRDLRPGERAVDADGSAPPRPRWARQRPAGRRPGPGHRRLDRPRRHRPDRDLRPGHRHLGRRSRPARRGRRPQRGRAARRRRAGGRRPGPARGGDGRRGGDRRGRPGPDGRRAAPGPLQAHDAALGRRHGAGHRRHQRRPDPAADHRGLRPAIRHVPARSPPDQPAVQARRQRRPAARRPGGGGRRRARGGAARPGATDRDPGRAGARRGGLVRHAQRGRRRAVAGRRLRLPGRPDRPRPTGAARRALVGWRAAAHLGPVAPAAGARRAECGPASPSPCETRWSHAIRRGPARGCATA